MVTIGMNYQVIEGKNEQFEKACLGVIEVMGADDGHTKSHLFRDVTDANSYLIVSDWASEDAFNTFIRSEAFKKVTNWGKEQILAGRPSHTVYKH
jgi:heme-degrading monooxygenase HmoA